MPDLAEIATRYDTDKAIHTHYLRNYERCFRSLRDKPVRLLELGIKQGGSLLPQRTRKQEVEPMVSDALSTGERELLRNIER